MESSVKRLIPRASLAAPAQRVQPFLVPPVALHTLICTIYSGFYRSQGVGGVRPSPGRGRGKSDPDIKLWVKLMSKKNQQFCLRRKCPSAGVGGGPLVGWG